MTADFSESIDNLTVTVEDTSTVSQPVTLNSITVSWGDGSTSNLALGGSVSHTYASAGTYQVTETVKYTSAGVAETSTMVRKAIAQPNTTAADVNADFTLTTTGTKATVKDVSTVMGGTLSTVVFNWGDSSANSTVSPGGSTSHTYAAVGSYPITQTVTATDGTAAKSTQTADFEPPSQGPANAPTLYNPTADAPNPINPAFMLPTMPSSRVGPQVSRASGLPIYEGGVAPSNTPAYAQGPTPFTTSKFQSLAVALRQMAQGGVVLTRLENVVASAASMHVQTLPQLVQAQQSQTALLTSIETQLKALNASLSTALPASTTGLGALGRAVSRALGESLYIVRSTSATKR